MTLKTESPHAGCFLVSEANGHLSREAVAIAPNQTLKVGHVLATLANGQRAEMDPDGTAPLNAATGILWDDVTTGTAAGTGVAIVRDAEVRAADLTWHSGISAAQITTARTALAAFHIVVRD